MSFQIIQISLLITVVIIVLLIIIMLGISYMNLKITKYIHKNYNYLLI